MNNNIEKLYTLAKQSQKIILGLMSGTSLDGLDIALCRLEGNGKNTTIELLNFETIAYSETFKNDVRSIFCKEQISLEKLCILNSHIGLQYAIIINETLQKWNIENTKVNIIASHGQTIYHSPKTKHQQHFGNTTLQIGDADQIAFNTNIITISDFRQKHIAAGGEGAPLAIYGDYFLMSSKNENRILLNIGGISNFTYLPSNFNINEVVCTDIGPGNALMDVFIQHHFKHTFFDKDAIIALQGNINYKLFDALYNHPFFNVPFPKSTGQEIFNLQYIKNALAASSSTAISIFDIMATLNYFTASCIATTIKQVVKDKKHSIYVSGGGLQNPLLIQNLKALLPNISIQSTDTIGVNADAKEAMLFAVLANECICGNSNFYELKNNNFPTITMGKISFPS